MTKLPEQLMHHLDQIGDETLRNAILQEVSQLNRRFGLVFERHMPEGIRLPGHPIKRGTKVCITHRAGKAVKDPVYYTVVGKPDREAGAALIQGPDGEPFEHPLAELIAGKEFGDISYPGLKVLKEIRRDERPDAPTHTVINGENHHVLEALQWTHAGKVDLIYIDLPYNTGNADWIYNDRYVDSNDGFRHSKWLSFVEKRLSLAKKLLAPIGVIFVAIDDNEHHRLRMLMDHTFGEQNFISNIVWQGGRKNDTQFTSNSTDYMLVYALNRQAMTDVIWVEPKSGANTVIAAGKECYAAAVASVGETSIELENAATALMGAWWKNLPEGHPALADKGLKMYRRVSPREEGSVYRLSDLRKPSPTSRSRYEVLHPTTGMPVRMHQNGWVYAPERMADELDAGNIWFGPDHSTAAQYKRFLENAMSQSPQPTFESDRARGSKHLANILGEKRFPFPKDHEVIARWIRMAAPKDAVILDFFGGSGTTAESVMRLNAKDGGTRRAILVTNNELAKADDTKLRKAGRQPGDAEYEALGVFHHVARPRLETVATGIREDGSKYSDGLEANLAFLELKYLEESDIHRGAAINDLAGLFWLKAGGRGPVPVPSPADYKAGFALAGGVAILLNTGSARALKEAVALSDTELRALFIVTDSDAQGDEAAALFEGGPVIERIYGPYLEAFQVNRQG